MESTFPTGSAQRSFDAERVPTAVQRAAAHGAHALPLTIADLPAVPAAALAPLCIGAAEGSPELERVGQAVSMEEAVQLSRAMFGDLDGAVEEPVLFVEVAAYNASPARALLSFATWLTLRRFACMHPAGVNEWARPSPMTVAERDAVVGFERNLERALKRLSLVRTEAMPRENLMFAVKTISRATLAALMARWAAAKETGTEPEVVTGRFMTATTSAEMTAAGAFNQPDGAEPPGCMPAQTDHVIVNCVIRRVDGDAGVETGAVMPERGGEVIFPPGTRFLVCDVSGNVEAGGRPTLVLRACAMSDAQRCEYLRRSDGCRMQRSRVTLEERFQTPAGALIELRELCLLAACEPRWAAERLAERDMHGYHAGNRLAQSVLDPVIGNHVGELVAPYLELVATLLHRGALSPTAALDWAMPTLDAPGAASMVTAAIERCEPAVRLQMLELVSAAAVAEAAQAAGEREAREAHQVHERHEASVMHRRVAWAGKPQAPARAPAGMGADRAAVARMANADTSPHARFPPFGNTLGGGAMIGSPFPPRLPAVETGGMAERTAASPSDYLRIFDAQLARSFVQKEEAALRLALASLPPSDLTPPRADSVAADAQRLSAALRATAGSDLPRDMLAAHRRTAAGLPRIGDRVSSPSGDAGSHGGAVRDGLLRHEVEPIAQAWQATPDAFGRARAALQQARQRLAQARPGGAQGAFHRLPVMPMPLRPAMTASAATHDAPSGPSGPSGPRLVRANVEAPSAAARPSSTSHSAFASVEHQAVVAAEPAEPGAWVAHEWDDALPLPAALAKRLQDLRDFVALYMHGWLDQPPQ
ncbi:hypothetical protein [Chitinasiproducens palmae]|uniref:Uncharacterized protein n=1 Tax=Chitinasiproducens palmae TaxID=1770053 RepID=A0A1H2PJX2_9BURK|nr:hypothetical protein [Chitinasiproducens palmae]SDV46185.1 hypothetical protein SAMN05216551_101150 [Chitinasiproducens palmae]